MPAWRREAEALVRALLGVSGVHWVEWGAASAPAAAGAPLVVSLVGHRVSSDERAAGFAALAARTPAGTTVVVADHNRPRRRLAALAAVAGAPRVPGATPAARWRRLAQPTARELQAAGFRVERLRFAAGERVQIVCAVRAVRAPADGVNRRI